jgi:UDP-N-acetyl-D-mannosaminuronic acid transferase (WecB/TagA/CpsF family)
MSDLKVGDKVYIRSMGLKAVLKKIVGNKVTVFTENNRMGFGTMDELEKFIEPKFEVGEKIIAFPGVDKDGSVAEIVKAILNKKRKTYYYVAFCTDDGYAVMQEENRVIPFVKKVKVCCKCGK